MKKLFKMNKIYGCLLPFANQFKYTSLISNSKSDGHFRSTLWDPLLIISQIIALQAIYYLTLGIWISIICFVVGTSRSLDHLFQYQEIHVRDAPGKLIVAAFILNAFTGAGAMWVLVKRTKLCLDFSCTVQFLHLLFCWFYNEQFPVGFSWWSLNVVCLAVMCICGEFLCMRSELKAIPLSLGQKTDL